MQIRRYSILASLILIFSLIFSISYAEPLNISVAKQKIIEYYQSGGYQKEMSQAIKRAHEFIISQAQSNQGKQKLAIVLDIDETSLSNYKNLKRRDFSNNPVQIHQDIMQGDATPILPMLTLYNDALKHNVEVFFITGRHETERDITVKNLKLAGYKNWSGLFLRSKDQIKQSATQFKTGLRKKLAQKGYVILASIGDQYSDIKGGFAKKGFKLPNPFYSIP